MAQISVFGLIFAKSVFLVHGVNERGEAVLRRRLTRDQLLKLSGQCDCKHALSNGRRAL